MRRHDEQNRRDARVSFGDLVNGNTAIAPDRSDQAFGQQGYADTSTDGTIDGFERAKFDVTDADNAALDEDVFEDLAIRASFTQNDNLHVTLSDQVV